MATTVAAILHSQPSILVPKDCGENEIQASLINSASAGATPAPATILRSELTFGRVGAKDALHSLWAKEGPHLPGSEPWMAG